MALWLGALNLGLLYAFMTIGVLVTFRIYDFPDITVDGSFTAGAGAAAVLIVAGVNPFLALAGAFAIGAAAGAVTAVIHTKLNVNGLLAGILVMTALYSLNLHIMGRSNIPLLNEKTFLFYLERINPGLPAEVWIGLFLCAAMLLFALLVALFLKTDLGIAIRAAGNNRDMAAANGVNVGALTIFGVALSNGLVGVSGGLVAQYQGFSDIGMGIGTIVIGLASVIIGESVLNWRSLYARVVAAIIGSVLFRLMIALALYAGMNPIDLKLLTAAFVLLTIGFSKIAAAGESGGERFAQWCRGVLTNKTVRTSAGLAGVFGVIAAASFFPRYGSTISMDSAGKHKIGFVQIVDHGLLDVTRDAFVEEMDRIGYRQGDNVEIILKNANGDMPTVSTILDSFVVDEVDVIVPISTPCTQAAVHKIKDRPVVFATVANPFIIGAGKTDADHLPNVTGVYGWTPMDEMMGIARRILPGRLVVGAIWTPAHANSVFNVELLKEAIGAYDDVEFKGATITSSSEVYEAAVSLVEKGINVFVLSPDNIVYSAFESVVKAARKKDIPIFLSDVERLADGALGALGYDYSQSGVQAAHLVDRVLKGENPKDIPFERYNKRTFGLNLEVAGTLGITLPPDLIAKATAIHGLHHFEDGRKPKIGIVQFGPEPNVERCKAGIVAALQDHGYVDGKNIEIVHGNAQADFSMINSIIQDFIRREVDVIVPLSTPCLQSAVRFAKQDKDVNIVFTYVFDPYRTGAATTSTDHLPNVTGVSCFPPVEKMLDTIKEVFPGRNKVGVVWNSSEANSEAVLTKARPYARRIGLELVEATATNPAEVFEASKALVNRGAQAFLNAGDNTLSVGFASFVKVARENGLPVFSADAGSLARGALMTVGPDYYQTGYDGGSCLSRVLDGEDIADVSIYQTSDTAFGINMDAAREGGFEISDDMLAGASEVVDSDRHLLAVAADREKSR